VGTQQFALHGFMASNKALQISSLASEPGVLSPERKRFNTLIRQIEQLRQTQTLWQKHITLFRQAHARVVLPLETALTAASRECLFALDRLIEQPGRRKSERALLREILCEGAGELLVENGEDLELKALFDKHSAVDFDTGQQRELHALKEMAEEYTGLDLGDTDGIRSDEDLAQRMSEQIAAQEAAEAERKASKAQRRRKTPAQLRKEEEEQLATQSVREIYRKLASAVHPDREPDPQLRAARTELMQKINQAYAANDLLTLLETQLQVEQVNAAQISNMSVQRLKQYNKVLTEQLAALKTEVTGIEAGFCMDFGVQRDRRLDPRKLNRLIQEEADELRAELARQQRDLRMLTDPDATRRWLNQQRRSARQAEYDQDFSG
jgi:PIN domain nuclease of toxin-antitoxin system